MEIKFMIIIGFIFTGILLLNAIESLSTETIKSSAQYRITRKFTFFPLMLDNGQSIFCQYYYSAEVFHIDSESIFSSDWKSLSNVKSMDELPLVINR